MGGAACQRCVHLPAPTLPEQAGVRGVGGVRCAWVWWWGGDLRSLTHAYDPSSISRKFCSYMCPGGKYARVGVGVGETILPHKRKITRGAI